MAPTEGTYAVSCDEAADWLDEVPAAAYPCLPEELETDDACGV